MDLLTASVCIGCVIVIFAIVLITSMFGIKEKTYEEAIAEQRKMPNKALLFGRSGKDKVKDKKVKRVGKKVKEKKKETLKHQSSTDTDEHVAPEVESPHVTIQPEPEVLGENNSRPTQSNDEKKKKKKDKVKPILVNKMPIVVTEPTTESVPSSNHFELTMPKDDLTLRKLSKSENEPFKSSAASEQQSKAEAGPAGDSAVQKAPVKEVDKQAKNDQKTENKLKGDKPEKVVNVEKQKTENVKVDESVSSGSSPGENSPVLQLKTTKEKKVKVKKDLAAQLQLSGDLSVQALSTLIQKAELSRSEVQLLIDRLLNKQQDHPLNHAEWVGGRQDPVNKLKKQLAEKEEALANETASSLAFQNKLKELRAELNNERSKFTQTCRQYDEGMVAKQTEIQNLQSRLHQQSLHFDREKNTHVAQIKKLQKQVSDDAVMIHKLQESGQQDIMLRQQIHSLEAHLNRINEQENALKAQIHTALTEREQVTASYNAESQKSRRLEEELRDIKNQLKMAKDSSSSQQELARQLEEAGRAKKEIEIKLSNAAQVEEELTFEKNSLQGEIHQLTNKLAQIQGEYDELRSREEKEKSRLVAEIATHSKSSADLRGELDKNNAETRNLTSQLKGAEVECEKLKSEITRHRDENRLLQEQVENAKHERNLMRTPADGRENGGKDVSTVLINHENESKKKDIVVEKLNEELSTKEEQLKKLKGEHTIEVSRLSAEVDNLKTEATKVKEELEAQKVRNNDLRQKNWKAMDALNNAEKSLENKVKETDKILNAQVTQAREEEQRTSRAVLERLLPEVQANDKNYSKWLQQFETAAKSLLADLRDARNATSQENNSSDKISELESRCSQLQATAARYQTIIADTEGMLNQLQVFVEKEEIRWNEELNVKQAEIDALKNEQNSLIESLTSQVQSKIKILEDSLEASEAERNNLLASLQAAKKEVSEIKENAIADVKKMQEVCNDRDSLKEKIDGDQERIKDLSKELVKLRSNLKIGQDSYEAEHKLRLELEEQIKTISCRNSENNGGSIATESAPVTERRKPRKSNWAIPEWCRWKLKKSERSKRKRHSTGP